MSDVNLIDHIKKLQHQNHIVMQNFHKNETLLNMYGLDLKYLPFNNPTYRPLLDKILKQVMQIRHQIKLDTLFEDSEHQVIKHVLESTMN